ncbi:MAG: hypothetical protein U1G05_04215 [Kiritimatiellia bacterium]
MSLYNQFSVLHVEFENAGAREDFERKGLPGVFVFSRIDRFADTFVEGLDSSARSSGIRACDGWRWGT